MLVCDLLQSGEPVEFSYSGLLRKVVFAAHGRHRTTNKELVRGYQIGGSTSSGSLPTWKLFEVRKILNLKRADSDIASLPVDFRSDDADLVVHCHR